MKVLFASSEIYPYAKTGGLADVADALPNALKKGISISRIMPFYGFMKKKEFQFYDTFIVKLGLIEHEIELFTKTEDDLVTYFVKAPLLSNTKNMYGDKDGDYLNNDLRFGLFCKVIVELSVRLGIEVLHLNDWHTALCALFIKESQLTIKTIFTIHNLAYQGIFDKSSLEQLSIDAKHYTMDDLEFYGNVNFLKAGITYSDSITTVSPTYAKEILTPEFGCGLDGYLCHHREKLNGILNGINYDVFDPSTDSALEFTYNINSLENKYKNKVLFIKKSTLKKSTLKDFRLPLFVMLTRLVEQKGIALLLESIDELLQNKLNLFILGEGGSEICEKLDALSAVHDNFEFFRGYEDALSHKVYAAADFLIMPSEFEPCGLNQFIAMRYGTVPIVHAVGGLKDSVHEESVLCGSGLVFENQTKEEFLLSIERALKLKKDSRKFKSVIKSNFECDFSFAKSASEYLNLYRSLV